jgi:hypothetical protein
MQLGDKLAIAAIPLGIGGVAVGIGVPLKYQHIPAWGVDILFWGGLALIAAGFLFLLVVHMPWKRRLPAPFGRVPLQKAAHMAFEAGEGGIAERLADRLDEGTVEERTRRHVTAMLYRRVAMWGKSLPSTQSRPIPPDRMWELRWFEGEDALHLIAPRTGGKISDVRVSRKDLNSYLAEQRRLKSYTI